MRHDKSAILADRLFDGRTWRAGTAIVIEDGRVAALVPWAQLPRGCNQHRLPPGAFLAAGFIDLQVNGGGGVLLNDDISAAAMCAIAHAHRAFGTTALLPTLITDTRERTRAAIAAAQEAAGH